MLINLDYKKIVLIEASEESEVSIEIKSLNTKNYNTIVKYFAKNSATQDNKNSLDMLANLSDDELLNIAKEIFPNYTRNLKGIEIQKENSVVNATIEDLYTQAPLVALCSVIITKLIENSTVNASNAEEAKELKK